MQETLTGYESVVSEMKQERTRSMGLQVVAAFVFTLSSLKRLRVRRG